MPAERIEIVREFTPKLLRDVANLLPQLSSTACVLGADELRAIIESPATHLFIALKGAEIIGMLTLVLIQIPTGVRAHIEDVVVDKEHRHEGAGQALTQAALALANKSGARTVELTSRPGRHDAVRLYEFLGFTRRDTGVFRFSF